MAKTGIFIQGSYFCEKWMKSRNGVKNEDTKKIEDKGDINISLDDKVKKLRELLGQFPEMENSNDFDNELEKRMKLYKEIRGEIEALGKGIEIWAKTEDAWGRVKDNGIIVWIIGMIKL